MCYAKLPCPISNFGACQNKLIQGSNVLDFNLLFYFLSFKAWEKFVYFYFFHLKHEKNLFIFTSFMPGKAITKIVQPKSEIIFNLPMVISVVFFLFRKIRRFEYFVPHLFCSDNVSHVRPARLSSSQPSEIVSTSPLADYRLYVVK